MPLLHVPSYSVLRSEHAWFLGQSEYSGPRLVVELENKSMTKRWRGSVAMTTCVCADE